MSETIDPKKIIDFTVVKPPKAYAPEPERYGDQIEVLCDVASLEEDKTVPPIPILKNGALKHSGEEHVKRSSKPKVRLN